MERADDGALRIAFGLLARRSVSIEESRIRGARKTIRDAVPGLLEPFLEEVQAAVQA